MTRIEKMLCPKCGSNNNRIEYHTRESEFRHVGERPGKGCYEVDCNRQDTEHLHHYCQCGYDWTGPTVEECGDNSSNVKKTIPTGWNGITG